MGLEIQVNKKDIPIVFSTDENYALYLHVLLLSIAKNSNNEYNYNIFILDSCITDTTKQDLINTLKDYKNFKITYIDVEEILNNYKETFVTFAHFSIATYARFFIADILSDYDKILYLDVDLFVNADISELYNINIDDYIVAAAVDGCYARQLYNDEYGMVEYTEKVLGLPKGVSEFNAGVLLINLKKWRNEDITQKCILKLQEIGIPRVLDQCVLNAVIPQKYIYELPVEWNYVWHAELDNIIPTQIKSTDFYYVVLNYQEKKDKIKIIHYTSGIKPWNIYSTNSTEVTKVIKPLARLWWNIAEKTPYYTEIVLTSCKNNALTNSNYLNEKIDEIVNKNTNEQRINTKTITNSHQSRFIIKVLGLPLFSVKQNEYLSVIKFIGIPIIRKKRVK